MLPVGLYGWKITSIIFKGPGIYLLKPVAKEKCENSKLAHGSSNKVNAEMLSEKVVLRKFFRLVGSHDDVTVTSPKIRKSIFFFANNDKKFTFCVKFTFMHKFFRELSMRFVFFFKNKNFTAVFDQVFANEK